MGAGLPLDEKNAANLLRVSIPLSVLYCPTRRNVATYPWIGFAPGWQMVNISAVPSVACRSDYAANGGDTAVACDVPTTRFGNHGGTTRPPDRPALRTEG